MPRKTVDVNTLKPGDVFTSLGVKYKKIGVREHDGTPMSTYFNEFNRLRLNDGTLSVAVSEDNMLRLFCCTVQTEVPNPKLCDLKPGQRFTYGWCKDGEKWLVLAGRQVAELFGMFRTTTYRLDDSSECILIED